MALSHLYADPNFHNLNHWGIIQALARKGICVAEPPDCALTETMLIQTNPLKMVKINFQLQKNIRVYKKVEAA
jgi:calmodulin-regulated spectrin-associated protein